MRNEPRWLRVSVGIFAILLRLYPPDHRTAFGAEMGQVFRELAREIHADLGAVGLLRLWSVTLFDLLTTALEERMSQATQMKLEIFTRLGGWALILAGLLSLLFIGGQINNSITRWSTYDSAIALFANTGNLLFAIGLMALRTRFKNSLGALSNLALIASATINVIVFVVLLFLPLVSPFLSAATEEAVFVLSFFIGILVALAGFFVFGLDMNRKQQLRLWKITPVMPGAAAFVSLIAMTISGGELNPVLDILFGFAIGGGTIILGILLQRKPTDESIELSY